MKSDIEIAKENVPLHISEIVRDQGIDESCVEFYGKYKAKIDFEHLPQKNNNGKLILVTAINPTPAGEGKTTVSIGLADSLRKIGKKSALALREPSLGPVFGLKGGATGGGHAQVVPMEDINLHFTGDFHAISAAANLLAAMLDNHIYQGNALSIDPKKVIWKRAVDMNDRQLRNIISGLGKKTDGVEREDGFEISVASEVMAVVCLSENLKDLRKRLSEITVAYSFDGKEISAGDLKADGAMCVLLKDAIKPNLVQTLEHTPAFIHGGPFANIAHGCNSIIATKTALSLNEYVVTEAGFGADLGAEKFIDIKCRKAGIKPSACVLVATVRALKHHGGLDKSELGIENLDALKKGLPNLIRHAENIKNVYGLPCLVAVNHFPTDTAAEVNLIKDELKALNIDTVLTDIWERGSDGGTELAKEVIKLCEEKNNFSYVYEDDLSIEEKLYSIARKVYHAKGIDFTDLALSQLKYLSGTKYSRLPICVAKTQYSFSDNPKLLSAAEDFNITVRSLKLASGAGFIIAMTNAIITMPGLPKIPAAENIDIDNEGNIKGLF